ncbi:MAG: hypothetical protein QW379_00595 [Thermoplasmata archaeon]
MLSGIVSDPTNADTDGDGLWNGPERRFTDALKRDTDDDGV